MSHLDPIEREILVKGYGFAIDEYRFETRLNWDRARDYLVINLGLFSVTTGLLRIESGRAGNVLVILLFAIGTLTSVLGAKAVITGHRYYRRAVFKKTLFELRLGLLERVADIEHADTTLAIATTPGMADFGGILRAPSEWIDGRLSRSSIVFYLASVLGFLAFVNVSGLVVASIRLLRATPDLWTKVMSLVS